jgi:hypothetical protein
VWWPTRSDIGKGWLMKGWLTIPLIPMRKTVYTTGIYIRNTRSMSRIGRIKDPDTVLEPQVWGNAPLSIDRPRALSEDMYNDEENRDYFEKKMKKYEGRISNEWDIPIPVSIQRDPSAQESAGSCVISTTLKSN